MTVRAYAPASIGNVSLGFDILGAALAPVDGSRLGDEIELYPTDSYRLEIRGKFAHKLPADHEQNLVSLCYHYFNQRLAQKSVEVQTLGLTLYKNLPIGSGLGSSASSVVATLGGLNTWYNQVFDQQELLLMMGELEGQVSGSVHYDNVAPCYLGGLVLMTELDDNVAVNLPVFENWYWVVCYSGLSVSTSAARQILPDTLSLPDSIRFGRQLGVFVHALHQKDGSLAASMMSDVIAEPHRKHLLPGFEQAREQAMNSGALAFGISGSGPTVFAVTNDLSAAENINQWLSQHYIQNEDGFSHICQLDSNGFNGNKG